MSVKRKHALSDCFWEKKSLYELTHRQWEMLCDGCGLCCLHKLEDENTGKIFLTYVTCRYLDIRRCRCRVYHDPYVLPDYCRKLSPQNVREFTWLPRTCAYRRIAEGRVLEWWHPLVSGDPDTVHAAGISVRNMAVSEENVHPDDIERFVIPDCFSSLQLYF